MRRKLYFVFGFLITIFLLPACSNSNGTKDLTFSVKPAASMAISTSSPSPTPALNKSSMPTAIPGETTSTPLSIASSATEAPIPGPTAESVLAPETNPAGDIPDNQTFITYKSPSGGYSLEVPEGWARSVQGSNVRFADKFDGVSVTMKPANSVPSPASAEQNEAKALVKSERAFEMVQVNEVHLPGGTAIQIRATANSDPDPVTGKQVRLEEVFYLFHLNDTITVLKVWAPQGTDNVDQWKRISESFKWK